MILILNCHKISQTKQKGKNFTRRLASHRSKYQYNFSRNKTPIMINVPSRSLRNVRNQKSAAAENRFERYRLMYMFRYESINKIAIQYFL